MGWVAYLLHNVIPPPQLLKELPRLPVLSTLLLELNPELKFGIDELKAVAKLPCLKALEATHIKWVTAVLHLRVINGARGCVVLLSYFRGGFMIALGTSVC